jgi:hypothetical protein
MMGNVSRQLLFTDNFRSMSSGWQHLIAQDETLFIREEFIRMGMDTPTYRCAVGFYIAVLDGELQLTPYMPGPGGAEHDRSRGVIRLKAGEYGRVDDGACFSLAGVYDAKFLIIGPSEHGDDWVILDRADDVHKLAFPGGPDANEGKEQEEGQDPKV